MIRSQYAQYEDDYYLEDEFYLLNKKANTSLWERIKEFFKNS